MYQSKYKMLIIEEDVRNQAAFKRFVRENEPTYDYILAESVLQASSLLSAGEFDVIISDFLVEDGTIFDIIELAKNTPVIITILQGEEEIAAAAIQKGALQYIIKDKNRNYLKLLPAIISSVVRQAKLQNVNPVYSLMKQIDLLKEDKNKKVIQFLQYELQAPMNRLYTIMQQLYDTDITEEQQLYIESAEKLIKDLQKAVEGIRKDHEKEIPHRLYK